MILIIFFNTVANVYPILINKLNLNIDTKNTYKTLGCQFSLVYGT